MFGKEYRQKIEDRMLKEGLLLKEEGRRVAGVYCAFTPKELIAAAGIIPVSLCAGAQEPIEQAELVLPRNLCPLIKSSYGFAASDTCPYFHATDFIVADTTCDGKKKMFELLGRLRPVHIFHLPQAAPHPDHQGYFIKQLDALQDFLEKQSGHRITAADIATQIERYNRLRQAALSVWRLNTGPVPLLTGREADNIASMDGFEYDLETRIAEMEAAMEAAEIRAENPDFRRSMAERPKILLTGCPVTNRKLMEIIEEAGAVVAAMENCGGLKTLFQMVEENKEPKTALAERYLNIPCPCMTPNRGRFDLIGRIIDEWHIDAVVDLTWDSCLLYDVESYSVREFVVSECRRPYLQIRTDYSENDHHQIGVRVEAFLEVLKG